MTGNIKHQFAFTTQLFSIQIIKLYKFWIVISLSVLDEYSYSEKFKCQWPQSVVSATIVVFELNNP